MPEGIPPAVVGLELPCVPDLNETVATAAADGFAFVIVPLVHPRYIRSTGGHGSGPRALPFTRTDALLSTNADWSRRILGRVTPLLDVDSPIEAVRKESAAAFLQEVHWAAHLSVTAVLMPTPLRPDSLANYAALLSRALGILRCSQVWVRIPMDMPMPADADPDAKGAHGRPLYDAWEMWNAVRTMCEHHPNLHVGASHCGAPLY